MREYGFVHLYADYSLFTYRKADIFLALLVYVDDIVLVGNDSSACREFKDYLHACFSIKDLCPLKYFLGIEVALRMVQTVHFSANANTPLKLSTNVAFWVLNLVNFPWRKITNLLWLVGLLWWM